MAFRVGSRVQCAGQYIKPAWLCEQTLPSTETVDCEVQPMSRKLRVSILLLSGLLTVQAGNVPVFYPTCLHAEKPSSATESEWRLIGRLDIPQGFLRHIAFSSDGNWLAAATARDDPEGGLNVPVQGAVILIETGKPRVVRILQSEEFGSPDAVVFSDDNNSRRRSSSIWYTCSRPASL